jgi:hypothetical protein
MKFWINVKDCIWQSDFDGEDLGYNDVNVVGFYIWNDFLIQVNSETGEIINGEIINFECDEYE